MRTLIGFLLALALLRAPLQAACVGDCDGDGAVTVAEVVRLVNVALDLAGTGVCPAGDANGDGRVTVDELVAAVGNALSGCVAAQPGPWVQGDPVVTASDCGEAVDLLIRQTIDEGAFDCVYDLLPGDPAALREACADATVVRPAAVAADGLMTSPASAELQVDRCRITIDEVLAANLRVSPTVADRGLEFAFTRPCGLANCTVQLDAPWSLPPRIVGWPVYVTDLEADALWIIDSATGAVVGPPVAAGDAPVAVAVTPDGRRAYVANQLADRVSVVVLGVRAWHDATTVGPRPAALAVTPDGTRLYVANAGNLVDPSTISVVATASGQVIAAPLGSVGPSDIAIAADGARAYVANFSNLGIVSVLDTASNTFVGPGIEVGGTPLAVALAPDGGRAWVTAYDFVSGGWVAEVDLAAQAVVGERVPVGFFPQDVAVTPDGTRVLVVNREDASLSVISVAAHRVVASVAVGDWPQYVAVTPDGRQAFVTNARGRSVSVVDLATAAVSATIPVGPWPMGIVIGPRLP